MFFVLGWYFWFTMSAKVCLGCLMILVYNVGKVSFNRSLSFYLFHNLKIFAWIRLIGYLIDTSWRRFLINTLYFRKLNPVTLRENWIMKPAVFQTSHLEIPNFFLISLYDSLPTCSAKFPSVTTDLNSVSNEILKYAYCEKRYKRVSSSGIFKMQQFRF